jgi:hypothetical protein
MTNNAGKLHPHDLNTSVMVHTYQLGSSKNVAAFSADPKFYQSDQKHEREATGRVTG